MSIIKLFRSKAREKDRFQALLRPHIEIMYRMAFRWTQSQADAEDLVQDVLVRLATQVSELEKVDNLKPWLIKVLYNRFVDVYRRQRRSPVVETDVYDESDNDTTESIVDRAADTKNTLSQLELRQQLLHAIYQLDEEQQDVVLLHDLEGYTATEVADIMGTSVGTVKSRLHRARNKLKEFL